MPNVANVTGRPINYDARTGDRIAAQLPGWPSPSYFYVATTTPHTVALRELRHVTQQAPGRYAGIFTYERLRQYGATYVEG